MTQKQMAQVLGISVARVGKIERSDPTVRIHTKMLRAACDHFDLSGDDMLLSPLEEQAGKQLFDP